MTTMTYHLLRYHDNSLYRELPVAVIKQVLKTGAQQINNQDIMQALLTEIVHIGDPGCVVVSGRSSTTS